MDELFCMFRNEAPVLMKKVFILRVCDYCSVVLASVLIFCYLYFFQPWFVTYKPYLGKQFGVDMPSRFFHQTVQDHIVEGRHLVLPAHHDRGHLLLHLPFDYGAL